MAYALSMLWHDRARFFSAILAVAFSNVLICIQFGILFGMFSLTSIPIDNSRADVWMGSPGVVSVDVGRPIPDYYFARLAGQPEVIYAEPYILGYTYWKKPSGGSELCIIVGSRLGEDSLGAVTQLTPQLRSRLTEPGAVVLSSRDQKKLGVTHIGQIVEINGDRGRIVGLVDGMSGLQGPYVFCSLETAKQILNLPSGAVTYVLGKCRKQSDVQTVVKRLESYSDVEVMSSKSFSAHSQWHWLTKTKAGVALSFAATLGLCVGAIVTRQSLYSATISMLKEYAVLRALGIPRWRMAANILIIAFWVGFFGILIALPIIFGLQQIADFINLPILMPWWLVTSGTALTWAVALFAGFTTLHALNQVEPMKLLR
ncbi:MAG: ABC transporter permease [Gemmataceae bacterium]